MKIIDVLKLTALTLILGSGFAEASDIEEITSFPFQRAQGVLITLSEYADPVRAMRRVGDGEYVALMRVADFERWRRGLRLAMIDRKIEQGTPWQRTDVGSEIGYRTILILMDDSEQIWFMAVEYANSVGTVFLLRHK